MGLLVVKAFPHILSINTLMITASPDRLDSSISFVLVPYQTTITMSMVLCSRTFNYYWEVKGLN